LVKEVVDDLGSEYPDAELWKEGREGRNGRRDRGREGGRKRKSV
jgi:hypothetical protein